MGKPLSLYDFQAVRHKLAPMVFLRVALKIHYHIAPWFQMAPCSVVRKVLYRMNTLYIPIHVVGDKTSNPCGRSVTAGLPPSWSVPDHCLIDPVLVFFHLKGDTDSLKRLGCERFSSKLVDGAEFPYLHLFRLLYGVREYGENMGQWPHVFFWLWIN